MTRRSLPPSRGQADRVGPAVHRRNGVPPSIQARTDRHRACRGLHRGALVAEAIMRCAQATVYDKQRQQRPPHRGCDDRRIRRRLPDRPDWTPAPLPARLADAIDRRSSNTTAGTGKVPMTTRIPRSAKHTAVTAPIPEAVREITRRVFGDSWTSVIRGGGGAS